MEEIEEMDKGQRRLSLPSTNVVTATPGTHRQDKRAASR